MRGKNVILLISENYTKNKFKKSKNGVRKFWFEQDVFLCGSNCNNCVINKWLAKSKIFMCDNALNIEPIASIYGICNVGRKTNGMSLYAMSRDIYLPFELPAAGMQLRVRI